MIISRKIMMEVLPYLNIPQTEEITDELLQELELTREDVENGRNAALIKEKSERKIWIDYIKNWKNTESQIIIPFTCPDIREIRKCHLFRNDR